MVCAPVRRDNPRAVCAPVRRDNPRAKALGLSLRTGARGLSLRTGAQTMLYLSLKRVLSEEILDSFD